jgi:hypothetical protein
VEIKIWSVSKAPDKPHGYKYSMAFIRDGRRILCYDNAEGKGDHRHYLNVEEPYRFRGIDALFEDFGRDLQRCRDES